MRPRTILLLVLVSLSGHFWAQDAAAQNPWRTRYVKRDGLFHVEKYRTGNGLTDNGLALLLKVTEVAGPILEGVTRNAMAGTRDMDGTDSGGWEIEYQEEQQRADELLERINGLLQDEPVSEDRALRSKQSLIDSKPAGVDPRKKKSGREPAKSN